MKKKIIEPKLFNKESTATPKHDEMLLFFTKESENLKKLINSLFREKFKYEIINWEPEMAVMSKGYSNDFYMGSIDLVIKYYLDGENHVRTLCIEFKPIMRSFSETLRQINVYKKYLESEPIFFVITYSDISKFKEIFSEQKIGLRKLDNKGVIIDG